MTTWDFTKDNDDMNVVIEALKEELYPTYNGTKYVLIEFNIDVHSDEAFYITKRLQAAGYIPVLAHVERYPLLIQEKGVEVLVKEGGLVQINAYSLVEEKVEIFRQNARK